MHQFKLQGSQKKKRKRKEMRKFLKMIIFENFPSMEKEIIDQVQDAQRVPNRINPRRNMPDNQSISY